MAEQAQVKNNTSGTAALLFSTFGLLVMLAIFVLAVWFRLTPMVILTGIMVAAGLIGKGWSALSLKRVYYSRRLGQKRLFPGEETELTVQVTNRKLLPVSWLEISDSISSSLVISTEDSPLEQSPGSEGLLIQTMLLWYKRATWQYTLTAARRGYFRLGPVSLSSADIFGLYPCSKSVEEGDYIIVYPRIFPISSFQPLPGYPPGDTRELKQIFQDPLRIMGIRDYAAGDPMKSIHWKASSRRAQLQTKIFEATTTVEAAMFIDVEAFDCNVNASRVEEFETALSAAASLAVFFEDKGYPFGLYINCRLSDNSRNIKIPPGRNQEQLVSILETLAKASLATDKPFMEFLDIVRAELKMGVTAIFIVPTLSGILSHRLADMRRSGHRVLVIEAGKGADKSAASGIPVYRVSDIFSRR